MNTIIFRRSDSNLCILLGIQPNIDGGGWELVRRVKAGSTWHPAPDQLRGTDDYGTFINDGTADTTFAIPFNIDHVQEFLFITGDQTQWLVATMDSVINNNTWYSNEQRDIKISSTSPTPYQARWYRREGAKEDPWISLTDYEHAIGAGNILYGGNSHPNMAQAMKGSGGANVFIRKKGKKFFSFK